MKKKNKENTSNQMMKKMNRLKIKENLNFNIIKKGYKLINITTHAKIIIKDNISKIENKKLNIQIVRN